MAEQALVPYRHVIVVTVGVSIIDKTLRHADKDKYDRWMGGESTAGELASFEVSKAEQGEGSRDQLDIEKKCFKLSQSFGPIDREITRKKQNRHSAEVSSLYMILKEKGLTSTDCRIVLIATDSADGVFAARLNKRVIAHRLFECPYNVAYNWKSTADDGLHESLGRLPIIRVRGLQVKDATEFVNNGRSAFGEIIKAENGNVMGGGEKLLNITGGFKGIIPTAIGVTWRYGWQAAYLYEETDQLLYYRRPRWFDISKDKDDHIDDDIEIIQLGSLDSSRHSR